MICPICRQSDIWNTSGPIICPSCNTEFEIDDRGECVFVDTGNPRIPMYGQVCAVCGLVQQDKRDSCVYCGFALNKTFHWKQHAKAEKGSSMIAGARNKHGWLYRIGVVILSDGYCRLWLAVVDSVNSGGRFPCRWCSWPVHLCSSCPWSGHCQIICIRCI